MPHAWIVVDSGNAPADDAALAEWCRSRLAPYKVPAGFTTVDALPRNDIGKPLRRSLKADGSC